MARKTEEEKHQYRNETQGWLGVRKVNRKGDEVQVAVSAGEDVWLTDEEVRLTIRTHRTSEGNPFIAREMTFYDEHTHEVVGHRTVAPLTRVLDTGAAEQPAGEGAQGSYAAGEEVGTPDAPRRASRSRKTAAAR